MRPPTTLAGHMGREMQEQPRVVRGLLARRNEIHQLVDHLLPGTPAGVVLAGRGSSRHAAMFGRHVMEMATGKPAGLAPISMFYGYWNAVAYDRHLAIVLSQSGATPAAVGVAESLRHCGAVVLGITNADDSPLESACDAVLHLDVGRERAVPATKTVIGEMAALVLVSEMLRRPDRASPALSRVPAVLAAVLDDEGAALDGAARLAGASGVLCTGDGLLLPVALEAALKLREAGGVRAEGHAAGELGHGVLAAVPEGSPAVVFACGEWSGKQGRAAAGLLRAHGLDVIVVGDTGQPDLRVPRGLPDVLSAFPAMVRAQQLAHALAALNGRDPDHPPGLSKVALT